MTIHAASKSPFKTVEWFSSGLDALDLAVGQGLPRGRIITIPGEKGTAKTTLALSIIKAAQTQGLKCCLVDAERKLDHSYAERLGVDMHKLLLSEAETGEEFVDDILAILQKKQADVVILDSVDAIVPRAILEATAEENTMGAKARLMAKLIRKSLVPVQKNNITFILLNQMRINFMTGFPEMTGGKAVEYYSTVVIKLRQVSRFMSGDTPVGIKISGEVTKNQVGVPYRKFETTLEFNTGFSNADQMLELAVAKGIITKEGNTHFFNGEKLGMVSKARELLKGELGEKVKALL